MNKFLLFFPFILNAFIFNFSLKKDELSHFEVYYYKRKYNLIFRWTLYKNKVLVVLYKYDTFPYQITLFKPYINTFRIKVADFPDNKPYLYVKVINFSDKITKFRIFTDKIYQNKIKLQRLN